MKRRGHHARSEGFTLAEVAITIVIVLMREKSKANTIRFSANTRMNALPRLFTPVVAPASLDIDTRQKIVAATNTG